MLASKDSPGVRNHLERRDATARGVAIKLLAHPIKLYTRRKRLGRRPQCSESLSELIFLDSASLGFGLEIGQLARLGLPELVLHLQTGFICNLFRERGQ